MIEDPKAEALRKQTNGLESELQEQRNTMKLGYVDPQTNEFQSGSSVLLRTKMRTADDEPTRKACYEGLRAIGMCLSRSASCWTDRLNEERSQGRMLSLACLRLDVGGQVPLLRSGLRSSLRSATLSRRAVAMKTSMT